MDFTSAMFRFSFQLLFCELFFVIDKKRRSFFWLRAILSLAVYIAVVYLIAQIHFSTIFLGMLRYLIYFVISLILIFFCFKTRIQDIVFAGTGGYAIQHAVYCTLVIIRHYTGGYFVGDSTWITLANYLVFHTTPYILVALLIYFFFIRPRAKKGFFNNKSNTILGLSFVILFSAVFLNVLSSYTNNGEYPINIITTNVICKFYSIICACLVLFLEIVVCENKKNKYDKIMADYMIEMQRKQYKISKESINMINMKTHDLKQQFAALKLMDNDDRAKNIEKIEKSILNYSNIVKTGNDSLDFVMMEKLLSCQKHQIQFSYIIDAKKLAFMDSIDIYSLFGNAIENAIQSLCQEEDKEKRIMSLKIKLENNMLVIHLENYFEGKLSFLGGLPLTTKENRDIHGFGLKSIKYIVDKYNGYMKITHFENMFNLDIIIPQPE